MKKKLTLLLILFFALELLAQSPVISNKNFSFGTYGRVGIGYGLGTEAAFPQSLNLNGMGSIGGRFEENDYLELASAFHFSPKTSETKTTKISVQICFLHHTRTVNR